MILGAPAVRPEEDGGAYLRGRSSGAWAVGTAIAAIAGWGSPETVGTVWTVLQALAVAAFAELQVVGLRRSGR